jgi:hypothetical protein
MAGCRGNHLTVISQWGRWLHRLVRVNRSHAAKEKIEIVITHCRIIPAAIFAPRKEWDLHSISIASVYRKSEVSQRRLSFDINRDTPLMHRVVRAGQRYTEVVEDRRDNHNPQQLPSRALHSNENSASKIRN